MRIVYEANDGNPDPVWVPDIGEFFPGVPIDVPGDTSDLLLDPVRGNKCFRAFEAPGQVVPVDVPASTAPADLAPEDDSAEAATAAAGRKVKGGSKS